MEKTSVFFRPTLQPPLVTVSSAQTELQYPFAVTLLCFPWLKKYHWLPASSALPSREEKEEDLLLANQDPPQTPNSDITDKNEYISLAGINQIHTYHSIPMDRSGPYIL